MGFQGIRVGIKGIHGVLVNQGPKDRDSGNRWRIWVVGGKKGTPGIQEGRVSEKESSRGPTGTDTAGGLGDEFGLFKGRCHYPPRRWGTGRTLGRERLLGEGVVEGGGVGFRLVAGRWRWGVGTFVNRNKGEPYRGVDLGS